MQIFKHAAFGDVLHGYVGRHGGVSSGVFATLNLGFGLGDDPSHVRRNRELLSRQIGAPIGDFVCMKQIHSSLVRVCDNSARGAGATSPDSAWECDGLVTNDPEHVLFAVSADCSPVLFLDPVNSVVGIAHVGRRGAFSSILSRLIETITGTFNSDPQDILVGIGPNISAESYSLSLAKLSEMGIDDPSTCEFIEPTNGEFAYSLTRHHRLELIQNGIKEWNIFEIDVDTLQDDRFFSERRLGSPTGRNGSFISLRSAQDNLAQ